MQFQVPQFIETEDKIVGSLTLKQFLYLAAGGGLCFLLFFFLNFVLWLMVAMVIMTVAASFAFIKINGRPLTMAAMGALSFYWKPRLYLWQREGEAQKPAIPAMAETKAERAKSLLDNLWEQLKTNKEPLPKREKVIQPSLLDRTKSSKERFEMMRKITGEREIARRVDYR